MQYFARNTEISAIYKRKSVCYNKSEQINKSEGSIWNASVNF